MRLLSITDKRLFNMYTGQTKEEEQDEKNSTQQTYLFTALRLIIHLHNLPDKAPCKKKILMKIETGRFVGRKYRGFMSLKKKRKLNKMQDVFAIFSLLASINSG